MASDGIQLEGDIRKLRHRISKMQDVNYKGIGRVLSESLRTSTRERFKNEKDPEGKSWKSSIRAREEGGVTLTKSAALKNSIRATSSSTGFAVGTNLVYARVHQLGDDARKITIRAKTSKGLRFKIGDRWITKKQVTITRTIPARPYLGISEEDMLEIKGTLEDALAEE